MSIVPALVLAGGVGAATEFIYYVGEVREREVQYARAELVATELRKPLLVVGRPKGRHPCGAVTVDLDPAVVAECPTSAEVSDVRALPLSDNSMGAAFVSHVLEHLPPDDIPLAWAELHRVADVVFVAGPKPHLLQWAAPEHTCLCYQLPDESIEIRPLLGIGRVVLPSPTSRARELFLTAQDAIP